MNNITGKVNQPTTGVAIDSDNPRNRQLLTANPRESYFPNLSESSVGHSSFI